MEYTPVQTVSNILCCLCGVVIPANPSNMCVNCIRSQVDITEGIPKQLIIQWCRGCNRYLQPPNHWAMCELESRELLTLCIKRIKGLNQVKLVDAGWVWTEPHSRRLKVKLTIQKEVFSSAILQQVFIVEFVVQGQQCTKCQKFEAKDTWNAVVQLRQKVDHKRTFLYLEQIILKHNAISQTLNIRERTDGLDFYFSNKNHGLKFVEFISSFVPLRSRRSEQLISTDEQNNNANYKHSFSVEIVPLSKDDLVCLSPKVMAALGGMGPVVLIYKISNLIHVIDPNTLQIGEINPLLFWNHPFRSLSTHKQLIELVVLDVTLTGDRRGKFAMADVQVARSSDFGNNDTTFYIRTHLGHLFNAGDMALGYDVSTSIFNDNEFTNVKSKQQVQEIILVKKTYVNLQRAWKVRPLPKEAGEPQKKSDIEAAERDMELFYQDIENDPEMRAKINLYKKEGAAQLYAERQKKRKELGEEDDDNEINLDELLDEMTINDNQDEEFGDEDFDDEGEDWDEEDDDEMDME